MPKRLTALGFAFRRFAVPGRVGARVFGLNIGCRYSTPVCKRPLHPTRSQFKPEASQTQAPVTPATEPERRAGGSLTTDVDRTAGELRLPNAKTGAKIVHLGDPAIPVLRDLAREDGNPWGITSPKPGEPLSDVYDQWHRIRCRAGIKDLRLHGLRHSYASGGVPVGEGLTMIGNLLGHNKVETTARYAHLANDPLKAAADRIASRIADIAG